MIRWALALTGGVLIAFAAEKVLRRLEVLEESMRAEAVAFAAMLERVERLEVECRPLYPEDVLIAVERDRMAEPMEGET